MKRFRPEEHHNDQHEKQQNEKDDMRQREQATTSRQAQPQTSIFQTLLRQYLQTSMANQTNNNQNVSNANTNLSVSNNSNNQNASNHNCSQSMIESLFKIVTDQTKSLETLSQKVEDAAFKNAQLTRRVRQLQQQNERLLNNSCEIQKNQMGVPDNKMEAKFEGEEINRDNLLSILFGSKNYEYQLQLKQALQQPLYRERNFNIKLVLLDKEGNKIVNDNKIPMSLALYTCENPPKFIEKNTTGQKMLKGYIDQSLLNGECIFQKIQIREVTSHYRNSWLYLVVIPCMTPLGGNKTKSSIDFKKIKPLVLEEVVVKAKKPKKQTKKEGKQDVLGQQSEEA